MTTAPVQLGTKRADRRLPELLLLPAFWAGISIVAMWIAVIVVGVVGPDIVASSAPGGSESRVPAVVAVAFFAAIATIFVGAYGFRERTPDS